MLHNKVIEAELEAGIKSSAREAELEAGTRSSNVFPVIAPLTYAAASSSSNTNNESHVIIEPVIRRINHGFDDEEASQQSEPEWDYWLVRFVFTP